MCGERTLLAGIEHEVAESRERRESEKRFIFEARYRKEAKEEKANPIWAVDPTVVESTAHRTASYRVSMARLGEGRELRILVFNLYALIYLSV